MKTILHKADSRGKADHGWLKTNLTFSFADYYDPTRMHFGVLRVLNDDIIAGGTGFGMHPHDNMEIITIMLEGALEHKDSMGNIGVIKPGEIQVMSAGTGIYHSEYNHSKDAPAKLLQIWLFPNKRNVTPRYDQMALELSERKNRWQKIIEPGPVDKGLWIHQNAWFHVGQFDKGEETHYKIQHEGNRAYIFVIEGSVTIEGQQLNHRDGMGVWETNIISLSATSDAEVLIMDLPMS